MTTPTKHEIVSRATELYMKDNENFNLPEVNELQEEGYLDKAKMELMCSPVTETEFKETVDSVFEEIEQAKNAIVENGKLRETIKELQKKIEQPIIKPEFDDAEIKIILAYDTWLEQQQRDPIKKSAMRTNIIKDHAKALGKETLICTFTALKLTLKLSQVAFSDCLKYLRENR